ncbi:hypothetical protein RB536_18805 [Escherichia coli]|nr:hypothetical protein RB536_18805 [Escherichia coli]
MCALIAATVNSSCGQTHRVFRRLTGQEWGELCQVMFWSMLIASP